MKDEDPVAGEGASTPAGFTVEVRSVPGTDTVVLSVAGELDRDTMPPLSAALEEHVGAGRVVVDCSALAFCDSSGLNALLRARLWALEGGGTVEFSGLRPPVDRMFDVTGVRAIFRVYETLDEALDESAP
ncbi:STAS domain-containing protein [Streptomyces sp. NPDC001728]|uniref:STAS domain-containing protein n=1 Tax=Streptomyces sp. NPDC001728 TaxID=3154396 RepID=UPI003321B84A